MKIIGNLTYRQWQKRNSSIFNQLTKSEQKELREKGYRNIGWNKVQQSWFILQELKQKVVKLFDHKLAKGDLIGAIDLAIIDSKNTSKIAKKTLKTLTENEAKLTKLAEEALAKYQPL